MCSSWQTGRGRSWEWVSHQTLTEYGGAPSLSSRLPIYHTTGQAKQTLISQLNLILKSVHWLTRRKTLQVRMSLYVFKIIITFI